jgi:SAM-dependent methyltransferase
LSNLKRIIESIPLAPDAKILELGCEYGHCSGWLVNAGYSAVAVDLSLAALSKGTAVVCKRLGFHSLPPRVIGDIVHLPFRDGQFDVIFCFATLHHFPSLDEALIEVWRVLRIDGIFFFAGEPMGSILGLDAVYQRLRGVPSPSEVGYGIHEGRPNYFQWLRPLRQRFKIVRVNSGDNFFSRLKVPSLALLYAVVTGTSSIEVVARKL